MDLRKTIKAALSEGDVVHFDFRKQAPESEWEFREGKTKGGEGQIYRVDPQKMGEKFPNSSPFHFEIEEGHYSHTHTIIHKPTGKAFHIYNSVEGHIGDDSKITPVEVYRFRPVGHTDLALCMKLQNHLHT
jgi:hypothetical protein